MRSDKFVFSTKAQNLIQLEGMLKSGKICDIFILTVKEWLADQAKTSNQISKRFNGEKIIVRSSAATEDSRLLSMAGAFCSVADVPSCDSDSVATAVNKVIDSYSQKDNGDIKSYEILIQPMLEAVLFSGVVFTRDLERFGPYYVINYDEASGKTDTITGGYADESKVISVYKNVDITELDGRLRKVIAVVQEVERITGCDTLDIEFAVDVSEDVHILQVRPLVNKKIFSYKLLDDSIEKEIYNMEYFLRGKVSSKNSVYGDKTVFGEMPDWNPAEIIGSRPKPLAFSLYNYIIMKSVWREARSLMGYCNPFPNQLMVSFAGRPFVDVRNSFNSLLPHQISESLAEKLVNYYIENLIKHPEFHDKVEFEIVISCLTFDFETQVEKLLEAGFDHNEIEDFREALRTLTDSIITDRFSIMRELEERVEKLKFRRKRVLGSLVRNDDIPIVIEQLLEDCIYFGTIPFSAFARAAFIGSAFVNSLKHAGILSDSEGAEFLNSIDTVATRMITDLNRYKSSLISIGEFLEMYGHLRPGTYDINSYRYDEQPDLYFESEKNEYSEQDRCNYGKTFDSIKSYVFSNKQIMQIDELIKKYEFSFSADELIQFIKQSIQKREYIKFEFTKNLSLGLKLITNFGYYHGFSRDEMAFVSIEDIISYANKNFSGMSPQCFKNTVETNKEYYELASYIHLPDLIINENDLSVIHVQQRKPNFITQKKVSAPLVCLDKVEGEYPELQGKVVLIENADPGYDWIFSKKIVGLITKYGGVASHMAIRCAEFALPAAIGCGEHIYSKLTVAEHVFLDCIEKKMNACGVFYENSIITTGNQK